MSQDPAHGELPSGAVTFVFTDVESSSELLKGVGSEAYAALTAVGRESPL